MFRPALAAAALAVCALPMTALPAAAQQFGGAERIPSITLTGSGDSLIDPDMATITAGVVAQAGNAADALRQNSAAMQKVFDELRQAGVAERDIQTSSLSVSPVYAPQSGPDNSGPRIIAYRANNNVSVIVRDLDALGPAIDALVEAGANNVGNVQFDREDSSEAMDEARREAIRNAMETARLYAEAGGFRLGRILSVNEIQGYRPQPVMMSARAESADFAATPTAPGQLTVEAQVNVEVEILQ